MVPEVYLAATRYKRTVKDASNVSLPQYDVDPLDASEELISLAALPSPTYPFLRVANTADGHTYRRNAANSAWIDEGLTDSLINAATVTDQLTGTSVILASTPDSVAALWQRGADIASAATISLPATGGSWFNITGTTGCSAISSAQGGRTVRLRFAGACLLTHSGTFILMEAVNETTIANAIYEFTNDGAADASGSTWRCTARWLPGTRTTPAAKTGNYTVLDTDRDAIIRFSGLVADATISLPAAASRNGFEITIINENVFADNVVNTTPLGVIIDPNGAEFIDGFTTRKTFAFSRITIRCDGTGWRTIAGKYRYFSGNQTITSAGALVLPHGLGVRPHLVWAKIQCTTAEGNYTQFDIAEFGPGTSDGAGSMSFGLVSDATNLNVRYSSNANVFVITNKTTGAQVVLTNASWRAQFYAED